MKKIYLLSAFLIFVTLSACSIDESIPTESQRSDQNFGEHKKELIDFQKSYQIWIQERAKMTLRSEPEEVSTTNYLISNQAYNLLLAYGYDKRQLDSEFKNNKKLIIAKAIQLYVSENQIQL